MPANSSPAKSSGPSFLKKLITMPLSLIGWIRRRAKRLVVKPPTDRELREQKKAKQKEVSRRLRGLEQQK